MMSYSYFRFYEYCRNANLEEFLQNSFSDLKNLTALSYQRTTTILTLAR